MAQSRAPRQGPTSPARTGGAALRSPDSPGRNTRLRILLVEDDEDHAFLARQALEQAGHSVEWVATAERAVERARTGGFDAAALDYRLPDCCGIALLQRIRQAEPDLPIVIVTAQGSEQVAVEAMRAGAGDYVVKTGAHGPELVEALARLVRRAAADRAAREANRRLRREAETDPLTGLYNRRHFEELLQPLLRRSRLTQTPLALALMDIDRFKMINDTLGHAAGDQVLQEFAAVLARCTRKGDLTARYGGDEFVVVMPDISRAQAAQVAHRIRAEFAALPLGQRLAIALSVSIGLATRTGDGADDLLERADRAMYAEKADKSARSDAAPSP